MESLLISLISVALVIVATVTMTISTFGSTVKITDSLLKMEQQSDAIRHTAITVTPPANYSGGNINLMVANDGQTNLSDFANWDLMVEYQSGDIKYLDYTTNTSPSANQWTVYGIFMSPIGWLGAAAVWGYALLWFLIEDEVKLAAFDIFDRGSVALLNARKLGA